MKNANGEITAANQPPLLDDRGGSRMQMMDAMRFFASASVVWIHTFGINPNLFHYTDSGRFSTKLFVMMAMVLIVEGIHKKPDRSAKEYIKSRLMRVYVPFLLWTAVYILLRDAKHLINRDNPLVVFGPWMFFVGSAQQHWFLPFIMAVSIVVMMGVRTIHLRKIPLKPVVIAMVLLGFVIAPITFPKDTPPIKNEFWPQISYFLDMSWRAMPNVFWGAAVGLYFKDIKQCITRRPWVGIVTGCIGAMCILSVGLFGRNRMLEVMAGALLFGFASLPYSGWIATTLGKLGRYSYGVYLTHVAFVLGLDAFLVKNRSQLSAGMAFFIFAASLTLSLITTMILKRYKMFKWFLP